jgi:hypothetical protein
MVKMKNSLLIALSSSLLVSGCNQDKLPPYNGSDAKHYWQTYCQDKPNAIQDMEQCRKSATQMRVDRLNTNPIRKW